MSSLIPFEFEQKSIRTITDDCGELWFVLRDMLEAMDSKTTTTAAVDSVKQGLGDGFVNDIPIQDSMGRDQQAIIIAEAAATYLISRSNTETSRRLNRFVHVDVLPALRKTGRYAVPTEATINPAQQRQLQNAIAGRFPEGKHRPYAWSRFNNHFALGSYKQLPASRLDEALIYIDQMPGAVLESERERQVRESVRAARFLLTFDARGQMHLHEVPGGAFVFAAEELPRLVGDVNYPRAMLPSLLKAAADRLAA